MDRAEAEVAEDEDSVVIIENCDVDQVLEADAGSRGSI